MARLPRVEFEGAIYHVTARGNERQLIYRSDADRRIFLDTLEKMRERFGVILHCYCLMPNHFHLVMETPAGNLSRAMGWLQTTYTIRFNRKYRRSGHLFQGRYKAHLVEADNYGMELVRYIHLNPVRPKKKSDPVPVERWESLEAYEWSSHGHYLGKGRQAKPEVTTEWLGFWHGELGAARREYRKFIKSAFGREVETPWTALKGGLVLGSEKLLEKAKGLIKGKEGKENVKWARKTSSKEARRRIGRLVTDEEDKRMKIWIRVELGGETMTAMARELGYKDGSGVHRVVHRLNARAEEDALLKKRMGKLRKAAGS
ncbi:MAG: transposase [Chthoniobacteraceae bacterium]